LTIWPPAGEIDPDFLSKRRLFQAFTQAVSWNKIGSEFDVNDLSLTLKKGKIK
jgi:hypothetical protein